MGKKVRVTVPNLILENLQIDKLDFEIEKMGTLGNKILNYYIGKEIKLYKIKSERGEIIQFNLTESNDRKFLDGMRKIISNYKLEYQDILSDADYLRNIFFNYLSNCNEKRERIVFHNIISEVEKAISTGEKIAVSGKSIAGTTIVTPEEIKNCEKDKRLYLYCYCENSKEHKKYKVSKILEVVPIKN